MQILLQFDIFFDDFLEFFKVGVEIIGLQKVQPKKMRHLWVIFMDFLDDEAASKAPLIKWAIINSTYGFISTSRLQLQNWQFEQKTRGDISSHDTQPSVSRAAHEIILCLVNFGGFSNYGGETIGGEEHVRTKPTDGYSKDEPISKTRVYSSWNSSKDGLGPSFLQFY